jgi:hypothetical protein
MAITRAQQVRQMLRRGSNPNKREGASEEKTKDPRGDKGGSNFGQFDRAVKRAKENPVITTGSGDGGGILDKIKKANQDLNTALSKRYLKRNIDYVGGGRKLSPVIVEMLKGRKFKDSDYLGLGDASPLRLKTQFGDELIGTDDEERVRDMSDLLGQDVITRDELEPFLPKPPEDIGGEGGMSDYERRLLELEQALKAQPVAPVPTPFAPNLRLLADGGMTEDAPVEGGIMDLESGRQMYFLGKLVKKATRAVKKIVKSPIGKAALAFGAYKLGSGFMNKEGLGGLLRGSLLGTSGPGPNIGTPGLLKKLGFIKSGYGDFGGLTGKGMFGLGAALTLSPFLMGNEEEQQQPMYQGADIQDPRFIMANYSKFTNPRLLAEGGEVEPVAKKTMPLLDMDGKEMDLREEGGFVPIGRMEKADDVPARLSKNEFVFTADAVRNAGDGNVDKGAEVMYNMMKNLESGGDVSEESQGLEGAREMFQTSQRLEEVL